MLRSIASSPTRPMVALMLTVRPVRLPLWQFGGAARHYGAKPRKDWLALRPGTHEGYVAWERAETIRQMITDNRQGGEHRGAIKHGDALLAGILRCRRCGRKLTLRYTGSRHDIPRYSCSRGWMDNGEPRCIAFGGLGSTTRSRLKFFEWSSPRQLKRPCKRSGRKHRNRDDVRDALTRDLEAARFAADRAFRQYDASDPQNRLVAAELELRWNRALERVADLQAAD